LVILTRASHRLGSACYGRHHPSLQLQYSVFGLFPRSPTPWCVWVQWLLKIHHKVWNEKSPLLKKMTWNTRATGASNTTSPIRYFTAG